MTEMRVQVHASILSIDAGEWERVSEGLGAGYGYHKIAQLQDELPGPSWVVTVHQGQRLVACVFACAAGLDAPKYVQPGLVLSDPNLLRQEHEPELLHRAIEDFKQNLDEAAAEPGLDPVRRFLHAETQPSLVVRNMQDSRIVVSRETDPHLRSQLTELVVRTLVELAEKHGLRSLCFPYATEATRDLLTRAGGLRWSSCLLSTTARYRLDGSATFDDYLARLSGRRRREVRREMRKFAESGIEVTSAQFEDVIEQVAVLEANNLQKYGWDITVETVLAQRRAWRTAFGDKLKVLVGRKGGEIVASLVFLETPELIELFSVGFDYSAIGGDFCYFNLTCYIPVQRAIERGIPVVEVGAEAVRGKYLRGCSVEPLYFCIASPDGFRDEFLDWLSLIDRQNTGFLSSFLETSREATHV